jgi:hypothetical protein
LHVQPIVTPVDEPVFSDPDNTERALSELDATAAVDRRKHEPHRAVRPHGRIEESLAVGQEYRANVPDLSVIRVHGKRGHRSAGGSDRPQPTSKQDGAVRPPDAVMEGVLQGTEVADGSGIEVEALEPGVRPEPDGSTVGGPERQLAALRYRAAAAGPFRPTGADGAGDRRNATAPGSPSHARRAPERC